MPPSWKYLASSRAGTSHHRRGEPCQDHACVRVVPRGQSGTFLAACADGAGSASHSALGARLACETVIRQASEFLEGGKPIREVTPVLLRAWFAEARAVLCDQAAADGVALREYSCTLLLVGLDETGACFAQIGDGAIVVGDGADYRPVFWPQSGEYANMTWFLTGDSYTEQLMTAVEEIPPCDAALLTDGLQALALHYASRAAHAPFFRPLFDALANQPNPEALQTPLENFLDCQAVNDRTDDDKTLILATNRSRSHAADSALRQSGPTDPAG